MVTRAARGRAAGDEGRRASTRSTATEQDWLDTIDKIKQAGESGQIRRFTGGDYAQDLATGDAVAVVGWAADAFQLQADNPTCSG